MLTEIEQNLRVRSKLKTWATSFQINQMALKELISIWNERLPNLLPQDPRTLLKTPRIISIETIDENGHYWHQGLELCLKNYLQSVPNIPSTISLNINVDGLPIYKSSKQEFWPIISNIHELPNVKPMVIGIYSGYGKPGDVNNFLRRFVEEIKQVLENGITIKKPTHECKVKVCIRCFICDSPARAFIKGIINCLC